MNTRPGSTLQHQFWFLKAIFHPGESEFLREILIPEQRRRNTQWAQGDLIVPKSKEMMKSEMKKDRKKRHKNQIAEASVGDSENIQA